MVVMRGVTLPDELLVGLRETVPRVGDIEGRELRDGIENRVVLVRVRVGAELRPETDWPRPVGRLRCGTERALERAGLDRENEGRAERENDGRAPAEAGRADPRDADPRDADPRAPRWPNTSFAGPRRRRERPSRSAVMDWRMMNLRWCGGGLVLPSK